MREKLYSFLFYHPLFKKVGVFLLNSSWFVNSSIYQNVHKQYINKVIAKYQDVPNTVVVENTNLCNSKCLMCPHSVMKRKQGVMEMNLFKKIIDECAEIGVEKVNIHNFGEPLMDKDFVLRLKYAKSKGIAQVGTSTNGAKLSKSLSKEIILAGLDGINFSLDACTKSTYEKIRIGLSFDQVMSNVEEFINIRNKIGKKKPLIVVDFIETKFNKGETKKFIEKWETLADKINITSLHTWGGLFKGKAGKEVFHSLTPGLKREPCRFLWTDMVINWDGRVSACCQDYEAKMVVGNINTSSLRDIWKGKILEDLRKKHLSGQISKIPLCSNCDYRSVWWLFK